DIGAEAVMVPMVGSAAQVRRILDSMKYAPQGQRGFAPQIAHDRYTPGSVMTKMREANRKTCFFAQIETAEGAENAKEIAAVRGVDCLWMGHFDLSCSLGIAGQYDHPRFKAAVQRVVDAAKQHGKALGRMVQDVETGAASYRQGFTVLAYHVDAWALYEFMKAGVSALRTRCAA
ncbi:MAG: hpch/hpai aldolase, partial [Alphaproteobacteria bacterium]|nr:hpch/hpai aldolase [Alphaproteobacteria bacterium]